MLWTGFVVVVLSAVISYPLFTVFANEDNPKPKVRSSKRKCTGESPNINCECKTQNRFKTSDDVHAKGEHFPPLTNVDIYVTENKKWHLGDRFGPLNPSDPQDVSTDGVETVATDSQGKFSCPMIWGNPLTDGSYDIVVDANQDGTFNDSDAIDGRSQNPGFKVR